MLANNNKSIINKLAKNTVRTNKRQFIILFVTVLLSAFMLFSVFTIGLTYLDLSRLQNTRLYGTEFDVSVMNGFTEEQREIVRNNPNVETVGRQAYSGYVKSTDADDTVNVGFLWCDKVFWENQKAPAITKMEGHYPKAENELLATKDILKECGKESLNIGDSFTMTYEDNKGIHTKEFIISGIWSGYGTDKINFYVSDDFYKKSGFNLETNGILNIKFKNNYVMKSTIDKLQESLDLYPRQVFQASNYIDRSITILVALCGLCLIICLSAYLLIFNILYLSVSGKIRYYGLLQTLGMTKKQLIQFIKKQMFAVGIAGIIIGILLGIVISLGIVPYTMKILGISGGNIKIQFYPVVVLLSALTTGIAILCSLRTPIHIATDVTPVEATKYRVNNEIIKERQKSKKGSLYWNMAVKQLKKDKRKSAVVFLSLSTSLIVFLCLTTIISTQGERTVYPNYWDADFIFSNATQTTEDINSLQPAIDNEIMAEIENTDGVKDIHAMRGIPAIIPYQANHFSDFWIKSYAETKTYLSYSEVMQDYQKNPEKYYGMIKGIDETEFDYLNKTLGNVVDKQDFKNGKTAILQFAGFEIPQKWIGSKIPFQVEKQMQEIQIGAINYGDYYGATTNIGANLIVSDEYLNSLTKQATILSLNIKYEQSYDEDVEQKMKKIFNTNPYSKDMFYLSKFDDMKTIQDSQGNMFEIGTVISLLLLFVGMLNYINTMTSSIQNRKLTFSIMESVGMSRKQIRKLLIRESLLYTFGSIVITLTAGIGITYIVFQSMNYMKIEFTIPFIPLVCAFLLVSIICVLAPLISYKKIVGNSSIVERLREYE